MPRLVDVLLMISTKKTIALLGQVEVFVSVSVHEDVFCSEKRLSLVLLNLFKYGTRWKQTAF